MNRDHINLLAFVTGILLAAALLLSTANAAPLAPSGWFEITVGSPVADKHAACATAGKLWRDDVSLAEVGYPSLGGHYWRSPQGIHANCKIEFAASGAARFGQYCNANVVPQGTYPNMTCATCPTGTNEVNGVCVPASVCDETVGQVVSSGMYDLGTSDTATPPVSACDGTCELSYNGSGIVARVLVSGAYHYFSQGSYTRTATACSVGNAPGAAPDLPPDTCDSATQDQGNVNGKFTCLNRTKTNTTTTGPEVTNPDGSKTTVTTSSNAETGEDTITTTTQQLDGSQTKTEVKTPTPGGPKDTDNAFCKANPTDPTCTKDDIPWGQIPGPETLGESDLAVSTDYTPIGGAGSCPADASVNFAGISLTWSYAPICTMANAIRPLVIGFAWLTFGLIVAGGVRQ